MRYVFVFAILILSVSSLSAKDLQNELDSLSVKEPIADPSIREKLYTIQPRVIELGHRIEFLLGGGQNFTGDSLLTTRQVSLEAQYHFDNDWSAAFAISKLNNQFTSSAQSLVSNQQIVPDVDYTRDRMEVRLQRNLFYGKIRLALDSALYFNQYVAVGLANNRQNSGSHLGPLIDVGFAHWIGTKGSFHWGLKDYYYSERQFDSTEPQHNVYGYMELGYLL